MREIYWCLVASCQMHLLTLRFDSSLSKRVAEIHKMQSEKSVYCVTTPTLSQIFVQITSSTGKIYGLCIVQRMFARSLYNTRPQHISLSYKRRELQRCNLREGRGGGLPSSQYFSYLRIVFFWLTSWTGANKKKTGAKVGGKGMYRVIHKSLRDFRTRLRNNQDRHGRKEHINK